MTPEPSSSSVTDLHLTLSLTGRPFHLVGACCQCGQSPGSIPLAIDTTSDSCHGSQYGFITANSLALLKVHMNGLKLIKYNVLKMVFLHSKENTLLLLMCDSVA